MDQRRCVTDFEYDDPALGNGFFGDVPGAQDGGLGAGGARGGGGGAGDEDRTAEIAEADIFEVQGDGLYALSGRAGLLVAGIGNPDELVLLGRFDLQVGTPFEMYLRDDVAIASVNWLPGRAQSTFPARCCPTSPRRSACSASITDGRRRRRRTIASARWVGSRTPGSITRPARARPCGARSSFWTFEMTKPCASTGGCSMRACG